MFSRFPGLLCLLPFNTDAENDFSNIAVWNNMKAAFGDDRWPLPADADLKNFKAYRDKILNAKTIDYTNAVYIAGQDKQTPCGYRIEETARGTELVFLSTAEGDQSVTWESGIPRQMIINNTVYYVSFSHGALSNAPELFNGIKEILVNGETGLMSKNRPMVRGSQKLFKTIRTSDFDLSPEGFENTLLGITVEDKIKSNELPVKVAITNGDLKYAAYPLLNGHFINDSILYAEDRIDTVMKGILKQQHKLGIYPGEIGTYELLLTNDITGFPGTILVGMGEPDKLTSFELTRSIEQGMVKYLLYINGHDKLNNPVKFKEPLGISSLIIGSGYGGLTIENSVNSILQGVLNANIKIKSLYKEGGKFIEKVEFIELYEDRALSCMYAIKRMSKDVGGSLNVTPDTGKINFINGARKQLNIDMGSEWWNRITITQEKNSKGDVKGMRFSISTGAAREDLRTIFTSTGVVEKLVESISTDNNWTTEKARAVFELLIPNDFKSRLKKHGNIIWVLDNYTARFPWELLQDNSQGAKPLCINAGMIRQLLTGNSRINIEAVTENTALIVGDPDLKGFLTQLPGALEEAKAVGTLLTEKGFKTRELYRESQEVIVPALMAANYKIIHLAGHGLFDSDPDKPSGMVIGKDNFLTTAEIAQMSTTPELVFVNCCFLGKTDGVAEEFFQSRFKLAANIGTQLINNGVKAVVVAGWAVDDGAALLFAKKFYENIFGGKTFGEAIRTAREQVFINFNSKNTWGAYQCYGDPFYKLRERKWKPGKKNYLISKQAEIDLNNLLSELDTGELKNETALEKLKAITDETDLQGIRSAAITELEAMVYKALNEYEKAIATFGSLLSSKNASYSFTAIEQYCNLRLKNLITELKAGKPLKDLEINFGQVMTDLQALIHLNPSAERYSLMGSAWKRRLAFYKKNKTKTLQAIAEAANNYDNAFNLQNPDEAVYSFTNSVTLKNILVLSGKNTWATEKGGAEKSNAFQSWKEVADELKEMEKLQLKKTASGDYWDKIALANLKLCAWLQEATKEKKLKSMPDSKHVAVSYLQVWKMAGTRDQKLVEIQHLDLIIDALQIITPRHQLLTSVKLLRNKLYAAI
jgi:CHAT domain-containing protein